jgi:hypothetical protein
MAKSTSSKVAAWTIACVSAFVAQSASAEISDCTNITSIPATISTQGVYCLKQHVSAALASGAAITVNVNNVTIDCNEFKIGNLAAGASTDAVGILATARINLTVRNCGIRGFRTGVSLTNGEYRVEDSRFDQNTQAAINVSGDGSAVRRNEVIDTGGGTVAGMAWFAGIKGEGDIDVTDNTVNGVVATAGSNGDTYGIYTTSMDAGTISGNRVRNMLPDGSGVRRGVWNEGGNRVTVQSNTVVLNSPLIVGEAAIRCGDGVLLNGASRTNTVLGTGVLNQALGLVNCTAAGGDFINPL